MGRLSSEAEPGYKGPVSGHVLAGEVVEQLSAATHKSEEAHPGMGVLPMELEMFGKLLDSPREDGYLDFHGASVARGLGVFRHDGRFAVFVHLLFLFPLSLFKHEL